MTLTGVQLAEGLDAPFEVSNELLSDAAALRAKMGDDGYLFFQNLIPAEAILAARSEILRCCEVAEWLKSGAATDDGIAAEGVAWTEPQPEFMAVYNQIQRGEAFHSLAHAPALIAMLETLFGEPALAHPRNIARIIFPRNTLHTTPSHQDYVHVQGTEETYTGWIPLGACPQRLGSLAVLRGSHRTGILPVHRAYGAGGVGIDTEQLPHQWGGGDFGLGDLIVFHSLAVHKALPNLSHDEIRLSVDYRYQPLSHPVSADSLLPHHGQISWSDVYSDWRSPRYQYYWRGLPIRPAERDPRVHAVRSAAGETRRDPAAT